MIKAKIVKCSEKDGSYAYYVGKDMVLTEMVYGDRCIYYEGTVEDTGETIKVLQGDCEFEPDAKEIINTLCKARYSALYSFQLGRMDEIPVHPSKEDLFKQEPCAVRFLLHKTSSPASCHNYWVKCMTDLGWECGSTYSSSRKTDPDLRDFCALHAEEQNKCIALYQAMKDIDTTLMECSKKYRNIKEY